jgi:hypothetical protein
MKDLSKYIETLIDEVNLPLDIRLQEDGAYRINVHTDLKGSWVLFQRAFERTEGDVRFIRVQLKTYLHFAIIHSLNNMYIHRSSEIITTIGSGGI